MYFCGFLRVGLIENRGLELSGVLVVFGIVFLGLG